MQDDAVAVYNAQDVINTCESLAKQGATDVPTATPGAYMIAGTATPEFTETATPTPTLVQTATP
jgi:hypothetical protein